MIIDLSILLAITIGLTEVAKRFDIDKRWLPVIAIFFGIGSNLIGQVIGETFTQAVLGGIMIGLMSVGIWETSKHSILGK